SAWSRAAGSRQPAPRSRPACAQTAASISSPSSTGRPSHDASPDLPCLHRFDPAGVGAGARAPVLHRGAARGARRAPQGPHARSAHEASRGRVTHHARGRLCAALGRSVDRLGERRVARGRRQRRPAHRVRPPRRARLGPRRRRRGALLAQARPGARPRHRRDPRRPRAERRDQRSPGQVSVALRSRSTQRGLAMLALVAIVVMGSLYWLMSGLAQPTNRTAAKRAQNAKVLQNAKAALIGYVAMNAATPGALITDDNPGSLPCPEAPGDVGTVFEGRTAPSCSGLPAVGRLPWRTLGIEKPLDAASEPLWYIVSPGWAKPNPGGNTIINSNTVGQLTVDGIEAVAVIIAPGERLNIPASANCMARNQARSVPSPAIDYRDYLDCQNATLADLTFTSSDPVGPFNDQVIAVTTVEILPVIEAAVAQRFERVFAPQIVGAYSNIDGTNSAWPTTSSVLPFAAPLTDPTSSNLKGTRTNSGLTETGTYQGLLPLNRVRTRCTPVGPATECT